MMIKQTMNIWGREFDIDIIYDCYAGEVVLKEQEEALFLFEKNIDKLLQIALEKVKQYCKATDPEEILEAEISNIFKYVKPKALFIKRCDSKERKIALLCNYRFNEDDGIAIVFKDEEFFKIGTEDIII